MVLRQGYSKSETEKVKTTIKLSLFELIDVPNFIVNRQLYFFGPNLSRKGRKMPRCEILCLFVHEVLLHERLSFYYKVWIKDSTYSFWAFLKKQLLQSVTGITPKYKEVWAPPKCLSLAVTDGHFFAAVLSHTLYQLTSDQLHGICNVSLLFKPGAIFLCHPNEYRDFLHS